MKLECLQQFEVGAFVSQGLRVHMLTMFFLFFLNWVEWVETSVAVICERRMAAKVKGKIYKIAVRLAMMSGLETVAQPKRQQEELQSPR